MSECLGDVHRASVTEQLRDSERRRRGPERERRDEESQHLGEVLVADKEETESTFRE